jgi:hypothetical protein
MSTRLSHFGQARLMTDRSEGSTTITGSVDTTTATTDTTGHFHLLTKRPVFSDEFYEVTVRSGDVVVDDNFLLNPITSPVPLR